MDAGQNQTIAETTTPVKDVQPSGAVPEEMLSEQQLQWIDYCAVQGLITEEDGEMHKMSVADFAARIGTARSTLYEWRKTIPNFWGLVSQRKGVIFSQTRTQRVWNALYMKAAVKMDVRAIQTWLANADDDFRMPTQPVKHDVGGGLMDLLNVARERKLQSENVIEGEVVREGQN